MEICFSFEVLLIYQKIPLEEERVFFAIVHHSFLNRTNSQLETKNIQINIERDSIDIHLSTYDIQSTQTILNENFQEIVF